MDKLSSTVESILKEQELLFSTAEYKLLNLLAGCKTMRELLSISCSDATGFIKTLGKAAETASFKGLLTGVSAADLASYTAASSRITNVPATAAKMDNFI